MKALKAILAATALSVLATAPLAKAQDKKGKMTPEQQIERIEQAVGTLTADQKKKITDIIAKSNESIAGIPKEEKEKRADAQKKQRTDIRAVLTAEQQAKYDEYLASMKKKN